MKIICDMACHVEVRMDVQVAFSFAQKSVDEVSEYLKTKLDIPEMLCKAFEGNSIVVLRSTLYV